MDFKELLEADFEWPRIGDQLLMPTKGNQLPFLTNQPEEKLYRLRKGYKSAADILVDEAIADSIKLRNLIYPIIFCYRHYLELSIKEMLIDYGFLANLELVNPHHRLDRLWIDFKKLLQTVQEDISGDDGTIAVEQFVAEFAKIDPHSDTFRYPANRKGEPFNVKFGTFDLRNLSQSFEKIENYFSGCDGFLNEMTSAYFDMIG